MTIGFRLRANLDLELTPAGILIAVKLQGRTPGGDRLHFYVETTMEKPLPLTVEIFSSPGCGKCALAKTALKTIVAELGADRVRWREVDILQELEYAVHLGVLATPAIAIDGALIFTSLPSEKKLRAKLAAALAAQS